MGNILLLRAGATVARLQRQRVLNGQRAILCVWYWQSGIPSRLQVDSAGGLVRKI